MGEMNVGETWYFVFGREKNITFVLGKIIDIFCFSRQIFWNHDYLITNFHSNGSKVLQFESLSQLVLPR